jgi:phage terminase large subunit-like protein
LDELELFTGEDGGGHDDQVDAASGAFDELTSPSRAFMVG